MLRKTALLVCLVLAAGALGATASARMDAGRLTGTVGPGFTITLTSNGKRVKALPLGTYSLTVRDRSSIHDFHIFGPGLNKVATSVSFVGTKTLTITLRKGTYTYQCDPHAALGMKATFTVT